MKDHFSDDNFIEAAKVYQSIKAPSEIYTNYAGKDISVVFSGAEYKGNVTYTTNNSIYY